MRAFCVRAGLDQASLRDALQTAHTPSFDECERRVQQELAEAGVGFGSERHRARVHYRPVDEATRRALDPIIQREGAIRLSPVALLLELVLTDPRIAERLASRGLTADVLHREASHPRGR